MKSMRNAGNAKLRGKRIKLIGDCCDLINFTYSERVKEAKREVARMMNIGPGSGD